MSLPFFVYGTLRPGEINHALFLHGRTRSEEPGRLRGAVLYDGPATRTPWKTRAESCAETS